MKKYFNKKIISLATTILLILIAVVGTTFAYYSDATASVTNTFSVGSVETEIHETFDNVGNKNVTIKNVGESDCYIRARISISPTSANNIVSLSGFDSSKWKLNSNDGYYYYKDSVAKGKFTSSLFTGYSIDKTKKFIPFEVTIYQEAVQAAVYDAKNKKQVYSSDEAWAVYDNGTKNK